MNILGRITGAEMTSFYILSQQLITCHPHGSAVGDLMITYPFDISVGALEKIHLRIFSKFQPLPMRGGRLDSI